jgi:hypothetical protein
MTCMCVSYHFQFIVDLHLLLMSSGTAYPSGAPEFIPGFQWGSCYSIFSFMCMFYRSLFVLLYFSFWPLCCLFFFDIRILITPFGIFKLFLYFCFYYISRSGSLTGEQNTGGLKDLGFYKHLR